METDKDHIHYMIETEPTMSISKIVNMMKSYTTYHIWKRYPQYLRKHLQIKNMVKNHRLAKPIDTYCVHKLSLLKIIAMDKYQFYSLPIQSTVV